MGEDRIMSLLQESLSVAVKTGAMRPEDTRRVIVDTTVQPKNIDPPPLKWSDLRYVLWHQGGSEHAKEEAYA
jgi:hypothetical protein